MMAQTQNKLHLSILKHNIVVIYIHQHQLLTLFCLAPQGLACPFMNTSTTELDVFKVISVAQHITFIWTWTSLIPNITPLRRRYKAAKWHFVITKCFHFLPFWLISLKQYWAGSSGLFSATLAQFAAALPPSVWGGTESSLESLFLAASLSSKTTGAALHTHTTDGFHRNHGHFKLQRPPPLLSWERLRSPSCQQICNKKGPRVDVTPVLFSTASLAILRLPWSSLIEAKWKFSCSYCFVFP